MISIFIKNRIIEIFISLFFLLFIPNFVFAISLNKTQYYSDESIFLNSNGGPWVIYDITDNVPIGGLGNHQVGDDVGFGFSGLVNHDFSIIETEEDGPCEATDTEIALTYEQCKALPGFVGEFRFRVLARPTSSGPEVPTPSGGGGGPTAYRPEVDIYSPIEGKTYGDLIEIIYEATDKNDELGQNSLGLPATPVTIFYSSSSDTRQRVQLGSILPIKGVFKWNTKELPEGDTYNIIISATDKSNETGESVSGDFSIDHTAPIFTIKTDPTVTRGEDVKIIVESTKELSELPIVKVAQNDFNFFDVVMTGSGKNFEGVYRVVSGYDGPAEIKISGKDLSGNVSELIAGGGQFSVGVEPPPRPIILEPLDREIASVGTINIKGKARKDTEVLMSLNGSEKFSTNPDKDGFFYFTNIKLRPDFNYGNNIISIISKDSAGNTSESSDVFLKFNIIPEIFIDSPSSGQTLGTTTLISVKASDKNKDKLKFSYEISGNKGINWTTLIDSTNLNKYFWDTTLFSDGEYFLKAIVDDGTSKKTAIVENLTIKNLLPTFSFTGGDVSFTNKTEYIVSGIVQSSTKTLPRANILSAEYSIDDGKNWIPVIFDGGIKNLPEIKFSLSLNGLKEGRYDLKFRARDSRGMYGRGEKKLIVIFEPPTTPIVSSLKNGEIINNSMDEDRNTAGVQITIEGTSKPKTLVRIESAGVHSSGTTDSRGKFIVNGVTIKKHGQNIITVFAEDEAGNKSNPLEVSVLYNNPPIINFLNPRSGRGLNHKTSIDFNVIDPDGDIITKTVLSYKEPGDKNFRQLDINSVENKFEFDVTNFKENYGYELRLDSSDGISQSFKTIKFYVDNTSPKIQINPVTSRNFKKDFKFEASGIATDTLSGIEFVEYSLDEEHWFKAIITKGYLSNKADFIVKHPFTLDDGEYEIKFRSVDSAGNQSDVWLEKIYVDTMPPRMGSFELSINGIVLYPEKDLLEVVENSALDFRMSLEADTQEAFLVLNDKKIPLKQEPASGLWISKIVFNEKGKTFLRFSAKDEFNNKIESKIIGEINVVGKEIVKLFPKDNGAVEPVSGAKISVLVFSEDEQKFIEWPAESYGFSNPIETGIDGRYSLFLPSGKFVILIQKIGFVNLKTNEFYLNNPKFINTPFQMKKREGVRGFIEDTLDKFISF